MVALDRTNKRDLLGRLVLIAVLALLLVKYNFEITRFFLLCWDQIWAVRDSLCSKMARTLDECPITIVGLLTQLVLMITFAVTWIVLFVITLAITLPLLLIAWLSSIYVLPVVAAVVILYFRASFDLFFRLSAWTLRKTAIATAGVGHYAMMFTNTFLILPLAEAITARRRPAVRLYRAATSLLFVVGFLSLALGAVGLLFGFGRGDPLVSAVSSSFSPGISEAGTAERFHEEHFSIRVPADHPYWTNTGVVVDRGEKVTFSARGTIHTGLPRSDVSRGPNGLVTKKEGAITPFRLVNIIGETGYRPDLYLIQGVPIDCLVAKAGDSPPFILGEAYAYTADQQAELFLGINHPWIDGVWADNTGAFIVDITVFRR